MRTGKRFWRLLGDYDRLCTDEAVALREINLAALVRLQDQKKVIGEAIVELAAEAGSESHRAQLERVQAKQNQNIALAHEQLARMATERKSLATAGQRLESFGKAYRRKSGRSSRFAAEG
jgi:hypothetical protein